MDKFGPRGLDPHCSQKEMMFIGSGQTFCTNHLPTKFAKKQILAKFGLLLTKSKPLQESVQWIFVLTHAKKLAQITTPPNLQKF